MIKKIFIYVFVLSFLGSPVLALAENYSNVSNTINYSEEQLINLIEKLQKQLEEVRKNKIQCTISAIDLSIGDGFEDDLRTDVKLLQGFLYEKGFLPKGQDGLFGKKTRTALIAFQVVNNIPQTGILDNETRNKIKSMTCQKIYATNIEKKEVEQKYKEYENDSNDDSKVKSINLTGNNSSVKWIASGYSKNGYKIVWSKNTNPTYPTRDGDKYIYLSEPNATSTTLDAFSGGGSYYVRVCEYLGGTCGMYSNQIQVSL